MPILSVLFVLGSVFYFVPSLFFDDLVRADISLKPDDQDLVDLGKLVYKNNCASCHGINSVSYTHLTLPTTPYV